MSKIQLDHRLKKDCYLLGCLDTSELLLMRNAFFPWFVLVPQTDEIEFYKLEPKFQAQIMGQINRVSEFIVAYYPVDKMNIGMIGNIVAQMHVHVVGRSRDDICWPGVVWGVKTFRPYQPEDVEAIVEKLVAFMQDSFCAYSEWGNGR